LSGEVEFHAQPTRSTTAVTVERDERTDVSSIYGDVADTVSA